MLCCVAISQLLWVWPPVVPGAAVFLHGPTAYVGKKIVFIATLQEDYKRN